MDDSGPRREGRCLGCAPPQPAGPLRTARHQPWGGVPTCWQHDGETLSSSGDLHCACCAGIQLRCCTFPLSLNALHIQEAIYIYIYIYIGSLPWNIASYCYTSCWTAMMSHLSLFAVICMQQQATCQVASASIPMVHPGSCDLICPPHAPCRPVAARRSQPGGSCWQPPPSCCPQRTSLLRWKSTAGAHGRLV